jgi:hypothetical protein
VKIADDISISLPGTGKFRPVLGMFQECRSERMAVHTGLVLFLQIYFVYSVTGRLSPDFFSMNL